MKFKTKQNWMKPLISKSLWRQFEKIYCPFMSAFEKRDPLSISHKKRHLK